MYKLKNLNSSTIAIRNRLVHLKELVAYKFAQVSEVNAKVYNIYTAYIYK